MILEQARQQADKHTYMDRLSLSSAHASCHPYRGHSFLELSHGGYFLKEGELRTTEKVCGRTQVSRPNSLVM